jgi:hypothetical protein
MVMARPGRKARRSGSSLPVPARRAKPRVEFPCSWAGDDLIEREGVTVVTVAGLLVAESPKGVAQKLEGLRLLVGGPDVTQHAHGLFEVLDRGLELTVPRMGLCEGGDGARLVVRVGQGREDRPCVCQMLERISWTAGVAVRPPKVREREGLTAPVLELMLDRGRLAEVLNGLSGPAQPVQREPQAAEGGCLTAPVPGRPVPRGRPLEAVVRLAEVLEPVEREPETAQEQRLGLPVAVEVRALDADPAPASVAAVAARRVRRSSTRTLSSRSPRPYASMSRTTMVL